jgi:hypothetical protein
MLIPITREQCSIHGLSFSEGPNFFPLEEISWWMSVNENAVGVITYNSNKQTFGGHALRRNVDGRFYPMQIFDGIPNEESALIKLEAVMKPDDPPEKRRSGERVRPPLFESEINQVLNPKFNALNSYPANLPAKKAVEEVYLALDNPDQNFVTDFQTDGFDSRLWELYLFAAFREQGVKVSQSLPSPDFCLTRDGNVLFVEAVTANPDGPRMVELTKYPAPEPNTIEERLTGASAERFAKTLKSKMDRRYWDIPEVQGYPFALAIADFHQSGSMTWTLPSLITYLYGSSAKVEIDEFGNKKAVAVPIERLNGPKQIPAGFFSQPDARHISCIIASNAATLGKFNRMGFLSGWKPSNLKIHRTCIFYNREGDQTEGKEMTFDIEDPTYQALWPFGEAWCLELEVYHNPFALNPIPRSLLPGATHFFDKNGEIVFESMWENRILASATMLLLNQK